MFKTAFAFAAAMLAATTITTAANAEAVRVGFGFPLGSFVAHSNQGYSDAPCRRCGGSDYTPPRRSYVADQPVRKIKATPVYAKAAPVYEKPTPILAKATVVPVQTITTAKLEDKLPASNDTATKPETASQDAKANDTTTTTVAKSADGQATVVAAKSDSGDKPVCRKYSATVGGLVDVACDQ